MAHNFFNVVNDKPRTSAETQRGVDPRTEETLWPCPIATAQDFEDAVQAGNAAFETWSKTTVPERQAVLVKMAERLREHADELGEILMRETGKSKALAAVDIETSIDQLLYFSGTALSDEVQTEDERVRVIATHVPLGLVGAITPWNFPMILTSVKVAMALVTGNCVLVKPSPFTPYTVLKWCELTTATTSKNQPPLLPVPGIFQALHGAPSLGALMTAHPAIAKITFTGTTPVGKLVAAACAAQLKPVTLELAGNDACVVCPDADLSLAVPSVASGAFFNAGQVCVAAKRVYVHASLFDDFARRLAAEVRDRWATADAANDGYFAPLANRPHYERVLALVRECADKGYDFVTGREWVDAMRARGWKVQQGGKKGFWIPPIVVANPPDDSTLVQDEQFGPILPLLSYTSLPAAVRRANLPRNGGLGASVYSASPARADEVARALDAGSVWLNVPERPDHRAFFAGTKDSGYGGEMGRQGLLAYCHTRCLHVAKVEAQASAGSARPKL